jgi:SnoaL-like domain
MDHRLQRLLDEAEIRQVHLRYCRGIDRVDFDLVRSCYHPDAIDRHGAYEGNVEGFIKWAAELLPMFESTMHFTGNQYVQVNGDVGCAEHYARAFHRTRPDGDQPAADYVVNVRYIDRMERRNGEWRIADRMIAFETERTDPTEWSDAPPKFGYPSRRDKEDPSYKYGIV